MLCHLAFSHHRPCSGHLLVNLDKWIFRFPDVKSFRFLFRENTFGKFGFERLEEHNKGVLGRPWTKRRVFIAFLVQWHCDLLKSYKFKIWLFGETKNRRPGAQHIVHHFPARFCLVKTPSIAIWIQKIMKILKTFFSRFTNKCQGCWWSGEGYGQHNLHRFSIDLVIFHVTSNTHIVVILNLFVARIIVFHSTEVMT